MLEVFAKNRIVVSDLKLGDQDPLLIALGSPDLDMGQILLLTNAALDKKREWDSRVECYRALGRGEAKDVLRNQVGILAKWSQEKANAEAVERETTDFINSPAMILQLNSLISHPT